MAIIVDFGLLVFLIFLYRFMTLAFLGASVLLQRDLEVIKTHRLYVGRMLFDDLKITRVIWSPC